MPPSSPTATTRSRRSTSSSRRSGTARGWRRSRPSRTAAGSTTRRRRSGSRAGSTSTPRTTSRSALTKLARPPHVQSRLLQHPQLQGRADEQQRVRQHQLLARQSRHQSVRYVVRLRQRGDRLLPVVPAGAEIRRDGIGLQQHRGLHPGQLEGERSDDARLRLALRAPAGAVRHARPGVELPAGEMGDRRGAVPVRAGLHRRAESGRRLSGGEPPGEGSADRPVPRSELGRSRSRRSSPTPATPERPVHGRARKGCRRRPTQHRRSASRRASAWRTT